MIKNFPVNSGDSQRLKRIRPLGWEDPLEEEMAAHSSTLAWEIPWTEEPGRLQSTGSQKGRRAEHMRVCVHVHARTHTHTQHYKLFLPQEILTTTKQGYTGLK